MTNTNTGSNQSGSNPSKDSSTQKPSTSPASKPGQGGDKSSGTNKE